MAEKFCAYASQAAASPALGKRLAHGLPDAGVCGCFFPVAEAGVPGNDGATCQPRGGADRTLADRARGVPDSWGVPEV